MWLFTSCNDRPHPVHRFRTSGPGSAPLFSVLASWGYLFFFRPFKYNYTLCPYDVFYSFKCHWTSHYQRLTASESIYNPTLLFSHLCIFHFLYVFPPSILLDLYFRFRGRAGPSTDGSALVGLTAPTPDAVQMRVSAWVQGSVRVSYSSPLWTETERSNPRLYITDWTIWHDIAGGLNCKFISLSWPSRDVYWPKTGQKYLERKQQGSKLPIFWHSKHQLLSE